MDSFSPFFGGCNHFLFAGVASISLLAIVCSSSCRQNVLETGKALWRGLNLPILALPMPVSPLPNGEGWTATVRNLWHDLVSHIPSLPSMPRMSMPNMPITFLPSVLSLPSLTMPSMPAMFTMRIDHYTHMPSLPVLSMPSLPSMPSMDNPFFTLVIAILLISLLLAFVMKKEKVSIDEKV